MGWMGMVAAGMGFLGFGIWHAVDTMKAYFRTKRRSSNTSSKPLPVTKPQLVTIAVMACVHMLTAVVASQRGQALGDGVGMGVPLERSGAALIFLVYAATALIALSTPLLPLPCQAIQVCALFAFGQQFLLFYLHRPDAGLESRYYTLLLVPIGACLLATASEIAYPSTTLLPLACGLALSLQGTWLLQMSLSLFNPRFIAKGCQLKIHGADDYVVSCEGMALMRGRALATLQFNCHMALLLVLFLPLYSVISRIYKLPSDNSLETYERLQNGETYELRGINHDSFINQRSPFSLELEEDDETQLDGQLDSSSSFRSVAI